MIKDETLRELFKAESDEHLQHLDDALLQLTKTPEDKALLEEAFREAHSLKGAARMLGLSTIQAPASQLEDELNAARRGTQPLDSISITRMLGALAAIRPVVDEAVGRGDARMARSSQAQRADVQTPAAAAGGGAVSTDAAKTATGTGTETPAAPPSASFHIESVRVETRRLDALMTHAGELTVTKTRIARRAAEVDALIRLAEDAAHRESARRFQPGAPDAGALFHQLEQLGALLARLGAGLHEDGARLDYVAGELESGIREIRLLPLSNVFRLFPRMVHELASEQGKEAELAIEGEEINADKRILEEIKDPLMHMLRNAVDHGIETPQERLRAGKPRAGRVKIKASSVDGRIAIEVSDDGRGIDAAAIARAALKRGLLSAAALAAMNAEQVQALIFRAGISTAAFVTDVSGRGVGMGVVSANVERLKGSLELQSAPGQGTRITMVLPVTLATVRVLIAEVAGHPYGLPVESVLLSKRVAPEELFTLEGRSTVLYQGQPVSVADLADLLELRRKARSEAKRDGASKTPCVLFSLGGELFGVFVDALRDEQEVVLKPQSALLERVRNVAGATILDSGDICMVLNPHDLLASMRKRSAPAQQPEAAAAAARKLAVLLAEDSFSTRVQETRILEGAGYEVVAAADGLEAWNKLATRSFDAVVTDVMMPNLDGLGLAERIRRDPRYADLPIVLVTSLASDSDKRRGLEAGANAYITKSAFDQKALLDCLERLI